MKDEEKIKKILEILPWKKIKDWEYTLDDGRIGSDFYAVCLEFNDFATDPSCEFINQETRSAFEELNFSLKTMDDFMRHHFALVSWGSYALQPEWRHDADDEKVKEWHKLDREMGNLFDNFEKSYKGFISATLNVGEQTHLDTKDLKSEFLDGEPAIKIGDKICPLPPYKNEHFFCRAVYQYPVNEAVDWSIIAEKMTGFYEGIFEKPQKKEQRQVYDSMDAVNGRIAEIIGPYKLFDWSEKTVIRRF